MARNTPLSTVRSMLKAELAKSLQTTSTTQDAEINQILFNVQQWLAGEYDWPFLRSRWDVSAAPGSRYLPYPTVDDVGLTAGIDFEHSGDLKVYVKWNNIWQEVKYGIREMEEFNYIDSDRGQVLDPIQRWMFDDESQFEIWPLPASMALLRFVGQRVPTELRSSASGVLPITWNDAATFDLDDTMVVYFAAAEYLVRQEEQEAAQQMLARASNRMQQIRAKYPKLEKPCIIGRNSTMDRRELRLVPLIVVGPH